MPSDDTYLSFPTMHVDGLAARIMGGRGGQFASAARAVADSLVGGFINTVGVILGQSPLF